jgi:hypothetical protein
VCAEYDKNPHEKLSERSEDPPHTKNEYVHDLKTSAKIQKNGSKYILFSEKITIKTQKETTKESTAHIKKIIRAPSAPFSILSQSSGRRLKKVEY